MITYDKENLFKEFYLAKEKDIKLSKKKRLEDKETDIYVNRIQFFKDHIQTKKANKKVYENLDINFEALLEAYQSPNPRDEFYMTAFGKTYAQKMYEEELELENEKLAKL